MVSSVFTVNKKKEIYEFYANLFKRFKIYSSFPRTVEKFLKQHVSWIIGSKKNKNLFLTGLISQKNYNLKKLLNFI